MSEPLEIIGKKVIQGDKGISAIVESGGTLNLHIHSDDELEKPKTEAGFFFPTASGTLPCLYYNLIVGYNPFQQSSILIPKERALTKYINDEVQSKFAKWSIEQLDSARDYPAVIIEELNRGSIDKQQGVLALIQDIFLQENGARIRFIPVYCISMSFLRENMDALAISKNEFYRTHWTIKQVDIFETIEAASGKLLPLTSSQAWSVENPPPDAATIANAMMNNIRQRLCHPRKISY